MTLISIFMVIAEMIKIEAVISGRCGISTAELFTYFNLKKTLEGSTIQMSDRKSLKNYYSNVTSFNT